jgi:hypothetical protein
MGVLSSIFACKMIDLVIIDVLKFRKVFFKPDEQTCELGNMCG